MRSVYARTMPHYFWNESSNPIEKRSKIATSDPARCGRNSASRACLAVAREAREGWRPTSPDTCRFIGLRRDRLGRIETLMTRIAVTSLLALILAAPTWTEQTSGGPPRLPGARPATD